MKSLCGRCGSLRDNPVSGKNRKIGPGGSVSFDTAAGASKFGGTCLFMTDGCRNCYAQAGQTVMMSMAGKHAATAHFARMDPDRYADTAIREIRQEQERRVRARAAYRKQQEKIAAGVAIRVPKKPVGPYRLIRIHGYGDFFDAAYVRAWIKIASAFPEMKFFGTTRAWQLWYREKPKREFMDALDALRSMSNVFLGASIDQQTRVWGSPKNKAAMDGSILEWLRENGWNIWNALTDYSNPAVAQADGVKVMRAEKDHRVAEDQFRKAAVTAKLVGDGCYEQAGTRKNCATCLHCAKKGAEVTFAYHQGYAKKAKTAMVGDYKHVFEKNMREFGFDPETGAEYQPKMGEETGIVLPIPMDECRVERVAENPGGWKPVSREQFNAALVSWKTAGRPVRWVSGEVAAGGMHEGTQFAHATGLAEPVAMKIGAGSNAKFFIADFSPRVRSNPKAQYRYSDGGGAALTLVLRHAPNPDLAHQGGYWGRPVDPRTKTVLVSSLEDAAKQFLDWTARNELGGGNMTPESGTVYRNGTVIARIAYNGRIFGPKPYGENDREFIPDGRGGGAWQKIKGNPGGAIGRCPGCGRGPLPLAMASGLCLACVDKRHPPKKPIRGNPHLILVTGNPPPSSVEVEKAWCRFHQKDEFTGRKVDIGDIHGAPPITFACGELADIEIDGHVIHFKQGRPWLVGNPEDDSLWIVSREPMDVSKVVGAKVNRVTYDPPEGSGKDPALYRHKHIKPFPVIAPVGNPKKCHAVLLEGGVYEIKDWLYD